MTSANWIRTHQAMELLQPVLKCNESTMEGRIRSALQMSAFRCQARLAEIEVQGERLKPAVPWSVPEWLWRIPSGRIRLVFDSYSVRVGRYDLDGLDIPLEYQGIERCHLQGLRFHPGEFYDFFQLGAPPAIPRPPSKPKSMRAQSTAAAIKECESWLKEKFEEDSEHKVRRLDFQDAALEHFRGRLSGRGFDKAWREAVREHPERARSGRPKGT